MHVSQWARGKLQLEAGVVRVWAQLREEMQTKIKMNPPACHVIQGCQKCTDPKCIKLYICLDYFEHFAGIFSLTAFLVSVSKIGVPVRRQGEVNTKTFEVNYSLIYFRLASTGGNVAAIFHHGA